jgi:HSP20 family molecular chaperone IbpA
MNAYDLAPLFRSGVGFDRLARLAESASRMAEPSTSYPPYNIERLSAPEDQGERGDAYAITVAVAGFAESDLSVDVEGQTLTITGHKERADKQEDARVLHRGIALRDFVRGVSPSVAALRPFPAPPQPPKRTRNARCPTPLKPLTRAPGFGLEVRQAWGICS